MKASELMIGDWVYYSHTEDGIAPYKEVICIKAEDLCRDACIIETHYEPILLTAEILGKNKFSKSRLMGEQRHFTYYLAPSVSLLAIYDADFSLKIGDCARYIKYVHQLQHALRLCGIEKEIEL